MHALRWLRVVVLAIIVVFAGLGALRSSWRSPLASVFLDVPEDFPYVSGIAYLRQRGIVQGYVDGTFRPSALINRAELLKVLANATLDPEVVAGCPSLLGGAPFSDVSRTDWFFPALCAAKQFGFVSGYADGTFRPNAAVTFAEASKLIVSFQRISVGSDVVWYKPFVEALASRGAIPVSIARFGSPLRRGELAEILYRVEERVTTEGSRTYEDLVGGSTHAAAIDVVLAQATELFHLINDERVARGIPALAYHPLLERAASAHAMDMVRRGYVDHATPEGQGAEARIRVTGYVACPGCGRWTYRWGEAIVQAATPREALLSWVNSDLHRSIILSPELRDIGIGVSGDTWVAVLGAIITT